MPKANAIQCNGRDARAVAAFARYVLRNGQMTVWHIEIDKTMRGKGLGQVLARELLQKLVEHDQSVVLTCNFMRKVARENPEFSERFLSRGLWAIR